jgi:hypothetical protein
MHWETYIQEQLIHNCWYRCIRYQKWYVIPNSTRDHPLLKERPKTNPLRFYILFLSVIPRQGVFLFLKLDCYHRSHVSSQKMVKCVSLFADFLHYRPMLPKGFYLFLCFICVSPLYLFRNIFRMFANCIGKVHVREQLNFELSWDNGKKSCIFSNLENLMNVSRGLWV